MKISISLLALVATIPLAWSRPAPAVAFESFTYTGRDSVFNAPLADGNIRNPVLAGFYPDPDICRVGADYYIVNSSFGYFPGIPVFHSRDLVTWRQIGNVIDRVGQLDYSGIGVSRGIFAPALSHHGRLFYLVCTFVDGGGNFLMTSANAEGPWSGPTWLGFDGIDPSLFFDDDGSAWIVNNGAPPDNKPEYDGHRAIYLQELDLPKKKLIGRRAIIVNGGARIADHPVWIEGPHVFKRDGWYYLICAEGGTAEQHSEVVFRSRSLWGPFVPGPANPILTQRTLPADRIDPVTCTGHAQFFQSANGDWWSVFLGCRPYEGGKFNTGRETFMLPVTWEEGWPVILPPGLAVPYSVSGPNGASPVSRSSPPLTGNFTRTDDFTEPELPNSWIGLRGMPAAKLAGALWLTPGSDPLWGRGDPVFVGRRLQHARFTAATVLRSPSDKGISAGLVAFQNETHHYFFGIRRTRNGLEAFVERVRGSQPEMVARNAIGDPTKVGLQITGDNANCDFDYSISPDNWTPLLHGADATLLSTEVAGGFVGATLGLHARIDP